MRLYRKVKLLSFSYLLFKQTGLFKKQSNSKIGYKEALTVTLIFNSKQMQNMPSEVNTVKHNYSEHAYDELIFIPRDFITCFKLDEYNK